MKRVTICPETVLPEWSSALILLWWTLLLCLPVHLFASNLSFLGLAHRGGQGAWAVVTGGTAALLVAGRLTGRPVLRSLALALSMSVYVYIGTCVQQSSPHWHGLPVNTGFGAYGILGLVDFAAMLLLSPFAMANTLRFWAKLTLWGSKLTLWGRRNGAWLTRR